MSRRPPGPDMKVEAVAGATTFLTMAYIVVVNPQILSAAGVPFAGALAATVLLSFLMTLAMGFYAGLPYAVAPGMGLNAFFTYSIVLGRGVPWPTALGMVFWGGLLLTAASISPLRVWIVHAIPKNLRLAAAAGIGLFLTFIGLKNAGFVVADPVTFVKPGALGVEQLLAAGGLLMMAELLRRRSPFAFLAGMAAVTAAALALGKAPRPERLFAAPDPGAVFLKLDLIGALAPALWPAILTMMVTDLFDSLSTFVGVSHAAGLLDEKGQPKNLREALIVDSLATATSGLLGTSSGTTYIESAAGIEAGGRTGWTAVFCALCFLPCLFLAPLAGAVPACATAPVLILVGVFMFRSARELELARLEDAVPAFLTVVLIPLSFSITQGILWGFLSHGALYLLAGRRRELTPALGVLAALAAFLLAVESAGL